MFGKTKKEFDSLMAAKAIVELSNEIGELTKKVERIEKAQEHENTRPWEYSLANSGQTKTMTWRIENGIVHKFKRIHDAEKMAIAGVMLEMYSLHGESIDAVKPVADHYYNKRNFTLTDEECSKLAYKYLITFETIRSLFR